MDIFGVSLVHLLTSEENFHFLHSVRKCGVFFLKVGIVVEITVNRFDRGGAGLAILGTLVMRSAVFRIGLLVGDSFQCHKIKVDELESVQQVAETGLAEVETAIVCHHIADAIMVAQVFDYLIGFALRGDSGDFASFKPLGILGKILLGIAISGDFVIVFHHQQGSGGKDFALAVVDNRAHIIHSRGVSRAAYRFSVQRAVDIFHCSFSFSLGRAYHRFPYLNYITYYSR